LSVAFALQDILMVLRTDESCAGKLVGDGKKFDFYQNYWQKCLMKP